MCQNGIQNNNSFLIFSLPDKHTIPGDRGSISNFDQLSQDLSEEIKRMIENDLPKLTNNLAYRNLHDFWTVCKNESK